MIKQFLLFFALSLSIACFAGEVNGTVKKVVKGKTKNLKDATLKFTYKKDATKVFKTVTDMMGSYTIFLPEDGDYKLELIPDPADGSHDAVKIKAVSIVSFEKSTRYDLELYEEDNVWKLDKK